MARILFVWELGRGFGHLAPYLELVRELRRKDHRIVFAARDIGHTERVFGRDGVVTVQAPIMMHAVTNPYRVQYNLSHLIHNIGFAEIESLFGLVKAWRHVYHYVQPDVAVFDHSPTALLAARGLPWKRIVSGSGFLIPPPGQPLPMMRYWQNYDQERLAAEEAQLLARMNRVLGAFKIPPLKCVREIYEADDEFLLTFKELDHYPSRPAGNYLGMFSPLNHGIAPAWPDGYERKVFAYLHPYKQVSALLKTLTQGKFSTLVYAPEVPDVIKKKVEAKQLKYSNQPLDVARVAAECDFAITNGTFGTTAAFLLYGKPVLSVPTNLERLMVARRVVAQGAGVAVRPNQPEHLRSAIRTLFTNDRYTEAARSFAQRYRNLDLSWQTQEMVKSIERLLPEQKRIAQSGPQRMARAAREGTPAQPVSEADPATEANAAERILAADDGPENTKDRKLARGRRSSNKRRN